MQCCTLYHPARNMMYTIDLSGKTALVTGASRGIGSEIAVELAEAGANIVINYNTNERKACDLADIVRDRKARAVVVQADVSETAQANHLIEKSLEAFGGIDILVNNAGITRDDLILRMKTSDWDDVHATNLRGVFLMSQGVAKAMMKAKRGGRIINISSVVAQMGNAGQTNYAATKAGIEGFTRSLASELGSRNITVNAIAPGFVETDLTASLSDSQKDALIKVTPLRRVAKPNEIAPWVVFLASNQASFITGEVINVNGGLYMG